MKIRRKRVNMILFVLIGIIALSIGYAAISAVNLIINGNSVASVDESNFDVKFIEENGVSPKVNPSNMGTANILDDTTASFSISGNLRKGDSVVVTYKIKNNSNGIGAKISLDLTNSNDEYYRVTEEIIDNELQAGDTTYVNIIVEMMANPFEENQNTTITAKLIAKPIEDETATGTSSNVLIKSNPESFATDSWGLIKRAVHNNDTSMYNIGDTKKIIIDGNEYTLRLANKSTYDWCENENYSETACGFVVEFTNITTEMKLKDTNSNVGGYPVTNAYTYLNGKLLNSLPADLKAILAKTRVISGHSNLESANYVDYNQKLYLLSGVEVFGSDPDDTAASTTTQLDYYRNNNVTRTNNINYAIKFKGSNNWRYWLRTANYNKYGYQAVSRNGLLNNYYPDTVDQAGIAPAFRIT